MLQFNAQLLLAFCFFFLTYALAAFLFSIGLRLHTETIKSALVTTTARLHVYDGHAR